MTQKKLVVTNGSGYEVRTRINEAVESLVTDYSGSVDPSTTGNAFPFMKWADTGNNLVKQRNSANDAWVTIGKIVNGSYVLYPGAGTASGAIKTKGIATIASSAGVVTLTEESNSFIVTGTEAVTSITGWVSGQVTIYWAASRTITHNATALKLQNNANRTVQIGDISRFEMTANGALEIGHFPATASSSPSGADAPGYFWRDIPFTQSPKTKILTPNRLRINIGSSGYALEAQQTFDVNQYASWDTKAASWQANKAYAVNYCVIPPTPNGYIYRCVTAGTSSTLTPSFPVTLGQTCNDGNVVWICQLDYAYTPQIGTRAASTAYTLGNLVRPATVNGYVYKCTTAGTTAATAPTFPTIPGSTVTDGTVVWTCQAGHNRAGRDFYIYACQPTSGTVPIILLSDNATIPLRYSASSSRKIGGFHCLCADVGTISSHTLTGYKAGDILPASVWDLNNRPISAPEGMVYDANTDMWVDIYLASVQGSQLASVYNAATADGASSPKAFHWYNGTDWMTQIKKKLMTQRDFVSASLGSNQGTNIAGSADPNTTGGHSDTAGRRMISNIGCEDMCGTLWQWGSEPGGSNTGASWANTFDGNDTGVGGQHYQAPCRALLGGFWGRGAGCGSRASYWNNGPLYLNSVCGLRGCAEPLRGA